MGRIRGAPSPLGNSNNPAAALVIGKSALQGRNAALQNCSQEGLNSFSLQNCSVVFEWGEQHLCL